MRKTSISVAFAVALLALLTGCHGSENSVTGTPSGNSVLTGQVVMTGDLSGSSPAGISVSSNGQVATTDNAGRFTFIGINSVGGGMISTMSTSKSLKFHFTRNDGIDAEGNVAINAASVTVQLQKHQATMVATGQQKRELEGKVTKISDTSITVNDASSHGDVTAAIDNSTVIRKGNTALTAKDISVGDQVHVKAAVQSDGSLTAFEIMVQDNGNGGGDGQTKELEGPIVDVSSSSITVHNASTASDVKAAITSSTVIRKGNTTLKWSDLHKGDQVHVKTTGSGDSLTATEIMLQNPAS